MFLCGSKEHPFVNHKISVNADETTSIIAQKSRYLMKKIKLYELLN